MKQNISAIKYPKKIVIYSNDKTDSGLWIASCNALIIDNLISNYDLGKYVLEFLSKSKHNLPHPINWKEFTKKYLLSVGFKSNSALMINAMCVSIGQDDNEIVFMPSKNGGTKGNQRGFYYLEEKKITVSISKNFEYLGAKLNESWKLCI